jgi:hypothetical protein
MMFEVVPLVERLVPGLLRHGRPSLACVCTTRPKYLVFDGDASRPACVVEFGNEARLTQIDRILSTLQKRMPAGTVPRSLSCTHWQDGVFVHIQEGLPGVPWFRLADGLAAPGAWEALLTRSVSVMRHLHTATRDVPEWTGSVDAGTELARQAELCRRNGTPVGDEVFRRVAEWQRDLVRAGRIRAWWQHGDFSLNNLIVSHNSMAVIDFDEFGGTLVPLHDAFGLALSMSLSQEGRCPFSLAECLKACVRGSLTDAVVSTEQLPGLLLHHLLWRINQCEGVARRARLREILIGLARDVARTPGVFLSDLVPALA